MDSLTDEQLMNRLAQGEMKSLGVLYVRYDALVKSALVRSAPEMSFAEVEELAHDVFLTVADKASNGPDIINLRPWLYGIALRKARTWRRNTFLRLGLLNRYRRDSAFSRAISQQESTPKFEMRETIARALENLRPSQRDVLIMHVVEGMTSKEIAQVLDISPKTVRTRLHRARKKLESTVQGKSWEPRFCKEEL
ncbi:MAG: RNA polymerase sigma factor [Deltaproteobacteria bacterium]|nr:RNA polymerase sigma factor [Deltaproteobacteria bacterium]